MAALTVFITAMASSVMLVAGMLHAQNPTIPPPSPVVPPAQKTQLEAAKQLLDTGQTQDAIDVLQKFLSSNPSSPLIPNAYLLLGHALARTQRWEEAKTYLRRFIEEYPNSPVVTEARFGLGTALLRLNDSDGAIAALRQAKIEAQGPVLKLEILRRLEEAYLAKPDYPHAIESMVESRDLVPAEDVSLIEDRVRMLVYSKTSEADLRRLVELYPQSFPGDVVMLRLLEIYSAAGQDYKVIRTAREFFKRFPKHDQIGTVTSFLNAQRQKLKAKDYLLGALLPLTGQLAPYSNQVLNGIKTALMQLPDTGRPAIGLVTKDSQDDQPLVMELEDLLEDYHPVAVIGPLLTRNLRAVAPVADNTDTVFFTPTATYPDVQQLGKSLFSAAVNNRQLVRDLAEYTIMSLGWKRLCVLASKDSYGMEMAQFFAEEVQRLGAELIAIDTYDVKDTDFGPSIKRLKTADLKKYGKLEPLQPLQKKGKQTNQYTPGFDAVFVPGDADKVALIAGQLQFHGIITPVLGTNALDSPEFLRIGGRAVEGVLFADSFFVDSTNPAVRSFADRYRTQFNEAPTAFAAQAYEATQLVLDAILKGATTGRALREALKKVKNAPGLVGPLSMSPTGYLERRYVMIQVKGGKFMALPEVR